MVAIDQRTAYPRRWWIAAILALMGSAPGYLYVGRPLRSFLVLIANASLLIALWHGLWGAVATPIGYLGICAVAITIYVFAFIDVIRLAIFQAEYDRRWYNRWWMYLVIIAGFVGFSSLPDIPGLGIAKSVRSFSIPSGAMMPTMRIGDYIIADTRAYNKTLPNRGDVIVFKLSTDPNVIHTMRVIGLPGEKLQMRAGNVFVNGQALQQRSAGAFPLTDGSGKARDAELKIETLPGGREYYVLDAERDSFLDETAVFDVPDGHYFVLGDNRDYSTDSRMRGMVALDRIVGRMQFIYWSQDASRIGQPLDNDLVD